MTDASALVLMGVALFAAGAIALAAATSGIVIGAFVCMVWGLILFCWGGVAQMRSSRHTDRVEAVNERLRPDWTSAPESCEGSPQGPPDPPIRSLSEFEKRYGPPPVPAAAWPRRCRDPWWTRLGRWLRFWR